MANGRSKRGSGQHSHEGNGQSNEQATVDLLDDEDDVEAADTEVHPGVDDLNDACLELAPELTAPEELNVDVEAAGDARPPHPLRLIELRREAKRLNELLREVYDEE